MGRNDYSEWIEVQGNWPHGLPAAEYQALARQFNPTRFNPGQWIGELVNAGMRYLVITSKHHDGFALWPSKASNSMSWTLRRFVATFLVSSSLRASGMAFGLDFIIRIGWIGNIHVAGDLTKRRDLPVPGLCSLRMSNSRFIGRKSAFPSGRTQRCLQAGSFLV